MYRYSNGQISLADFKQPVGMNLKESNRWVKKAQTIPWPEIEKRYAALFTNRKGNVAKPLRLALGACIIQAEYGYSDEGTALQFQENPYLQYFCNGLCYNWQEAITLNSFHIIPFYWVVWSLFSIMDLKEFRNGFFFCPAISFSCRALGGYFSRTPIKANGLDPYTYLKLLLTELPYLGKNPASDKLDLFMPWTAAIRKNCILPTKKISPEDL